MIESFTKAIQKGMEYVNSHSSKEVAEVIKPQFDEMDATVLATIIQRYQEQDTWKNDLVFSEEAFDLLQDILLDAQVVETKVPYQNLVNTEFAEKVK